MGRYLRGQCRIARCMPLDPVRVPPSDGVAIASGRRRRRSGRGAIRTLRGRLALALGAAGCGFVAPPAIPPLETPEPAPPSPPPIEEPLIVRSVTFAPGSPEIHAAMAGALDVAAAPIRERELRVAIEGHTDSLGADAENQALSLQRAEAVRRYLVRKGVPPERLVVRALGEAHPVASNDSPDGRARNRRVELEVLH